MHSGDFIWTAVGIFHFPVDEHKMKTSQLSAFGVSLSESKRLLSGTTATLQHSYRETSIKLQTQRQVPTPTIAEITTE